MVKPVRHSNVVRGGFAGGFSGRWRWRLLRDIGRNGAADINEERVFYGETNTHRLDGRPGECVAQSVAAVDDPEPVFGDDCVVTPLIHELLAMGTKQFLSVAIVQREVRVPLWHEQPSTRRNLGRGERVSAEKRRGRCLNEKAEAGAPATFLVGVLTRV